MVTSIKGIELQAGEETVDYLVSSQLDAEMLTPADIDSQISSEHVTVSYSSKILQICSYAVQFVGLFKTRVVPNQLINDHVP